MARRTLGSRTTREDTDASSWRHVAGVLREEAATVGLSPDVARLYRNLATRFAVAAQGTPGPRGEPSGLTVVNGDSQPPLDGRDVLREIAPVIAERLHRVPSDDPWRSSLEQLVGAGRGF